MFAPAAMFFLVLVEAASGQSSTLISLNQAIDLALAHNHSIKATRTLILQNQAQEITANLRPNPTLGADSQFVPFFSPQDFSGDNLDQTQQSMSGSDTCSNAVTSGNGACKPRAIKPPSLVPRSVTPNEPWLST
jgi:outer membrane protein TolC